MSDLVARVQYIANKSKELKDTLPDVISAPIEFACIFCQSQVEYDFYINSIKSLGKIVELTKMGDTYFLDEPISTNSGSLRFVKVRKPDLQRPEQGDADFNTNYDEFSEKYKTDSRFEVVERENFKYLRYSNPQYDVMACFSDKPKSKVLGIKL